MIPLNDNYPLFEPDQLLTSEHLNSMFSFLEEQDRLTRTNLIGIGIVCGLKIIVASDFKTLTITQGTGVTSEGYLVAVEYENFTRFRKFDAVQPLYYDLFVKTENDGTGEVKKQKYDLWELLPQSTQSGDELTQVFLSDKVVLLFYEILEEKAKNCDPGSCDDKGTNVTVTIRKLLIRKSDADSIIQEIETETNQTFVMSQSIIDRISLPEIKLPRFNVPATNLVYTSDIFEAYQKIFTSSFINLLGTALNSIFNIYGFYVSDKYTTNPFQNFITNYKFLYEGSIFGNNLLNIQYLYDFLSDIIESYNELRLTGLKLRGVCCPDDRLFPRHLFLGEAVTSSDDIITKYRNYFIPSPILETQGELLTEIRILFQKLVLILSKLNMPFPKADTNNLGIDLNVKITPSKLGDFLLSEKSIPYYYDVNDGSYPLYKSWDYSKTLRGAADKNLSYNSKKYNFSDDIINNPLKYEIEPYNFLRIEGHIGKRFDDVLFTLNYLKHNYRLPFDMIAVTASINDGKPDLSKFKCHFQDLEALYYSLKADLICRLCKSAIYLYDIPVKIADPVDIGDGTPKVDFIRKCNPNFRFKANTYGALFEKFYPILKDSGRVDARIFINTSDFRDIADNTDIKVSNNQLLIIGILYQLVRLSNTLTPYLNTFNYTNFSAENTRLLTINGTLTSQLKNSISNDATAVINFRYEDIIDHLDDIYRNCHLKSFQALLDEYSRRIEAIMKLHQFGEYILSHPGIQHKAGVPMGGTFIIVYHEKPVSITAPGNFTVAADSVVADRAAMTENVDMKSVSNILAEVKSGTFRKTFAAESASKKQELLAAVDNLKKIGVSAEIISNIFNDLKAKQPVSKFDSQIANYQDGVVVADFYLPYLCCSDCPPIQFVLPLPELKITFGLTQNEYCSDDKQKYIFTINPATGIVTGEGVTKESDGVFSFQPSLVNLGGNKDKQVTFVYKIDDENSASFSVKVYQKPETNINFIANTNNPLELTFSVDKPELLSSVEWNFGDGSPVSTEFSPVHVYQSGGKYNVSIKAKNGPCETALNISVEIKEPEPLGLSLPKEAFCNSDESSYQFVVSPSGGKVTGEGVSSSSGVFSFTPIKVNLGTADSEPVTFTYTAPDSRSINLTIQCFAIPSAEISTDQIGTDGTTFAFVAANAKFAKTFNWDFGDGINATGEFVMHTFTKPGTYIVTLKVSNGECSFSTSAEIVIKEPGIVSIALARNTFCSADTNSYAYAVSPAGGKVTGEGVTQTPGAADFIFNPHLVLLNELDSKTVTSVYTAPDGRTASTSVQVFAQPFAEIGFVSQPGSKIVDFSALNTQFAKTFDWDFGDGTTGTGEKVSNTYKKTGKFVVSLKVSNGDCSFNTETTIEIKANQVIKNCQSFGIVLERFKSLSSINPDLFPAFIKNYKSYRDLTIFFDKMSAIITLSSAEQIKFFTVNRIDPLWISNLFVPNIFQEFRILALATFRLLSDLVTTVACIKPDDINQGLVIDELTKNISGALSSIQPQIPLFSTPEKSILTDMLFDINDEASRVINNDEVTKKPNLVQFLTLMAEIFKKAGIA